MPDDLNIAGSFELSEALSPEKLQQQIVDIRAQFPAPAHPLFLLFTGSKNESGLSWCPDCTRAAPVVFSALEEYCPDSVLLILNCPRAEYRDQTFTYRTNERIQLNSVPTLVSWQDDVGVVERLGDADCQRGQAVAALVQNHAAGSK
mmetsp:Transcript_6829/g.13125  ORF Transcript_6829/g.13125 Transcript_6829/m.13125 type:complete len:147 (+) Transcript_6829:36-476(+)